MVLKDTLLYKYLHAELVRLNGKDRVIECDVFKINDLVINDVEECSVRFTINESEVWIYIYDKENMLSGVIPPFVISNPFETNAFKTAIEYVQIYKANLTTRITIRDD